PLWLAPEQMRVLTISEKSNDYAQKLHQRLKAEGFRCEVDMSNEKVGAKIIRAHNDRLAYMLVVGPKEAETQSVNVRMRGSNENKSVGIEQFIAAAREKIKTKTSDLSL
ncbi:MAG: His/Gly/Thr/Pro-type tRNA ligase C-terminal domain-containing protein, partial [Phycisphaerae bacterium]|nr:His/Gly/Thr/Pro-type tRNA ligase C-terminal domain-containing protein [Phycisphaerae bacterium]